MILDRRWRGGRDVGCRLWRRRQDPHSLEIDIDWSYLITICSRRTRASISYLCNAENNSARGLSPILFLRSSSLRVERTVMSYRYRIQNNRNNSCEATSASCNGIKGIQTSLISFADRGCAETQNETCCGRDIQRREINGARHRAGGGMLLFWATTMCCADPCRQYVQPPFETASPKLRFIPVLWRPFFLDKDSYVETADSNLCHGNDHTLTYDLRCEPPHLSHIAILTYPRSKSIHRRIDTPHTLISV